MSPELPVEDRVRQLEDKLIAIEAQRGMVRLGTPTLTLIWFAFIAAVSAIIFVVRVDVGLQQHVKTDSNDLLELKLDAHILEDGHHVSIERINELTKRVDRLEQKEAGK